MKYTKEQHKWQNKDYGQKSTSRFNRRKIEKLLLQFSYNIKDKIWWKSLSHSDQRSIYYDVQNEWSKGKYQITEINIQKYKSQYPGDRSQQRNDVIHIILGIK